MNYFVNQYIMSQNSSVEHAEFARVKLFKQFDQPAKIVTRDFDPLLHATIKKFGIDDDQVVNMFDFFAKTTDYQGDPVSFDDLRISEDYQFTTGNNSRTFSDGGRLVGEVTFAPATVAKVQRVEYYDAAGNLSLREQYDIRGYKSEEEYFGQDGQIHYQALYRPDQTKYLERFYVQSTENTPINSLNRLIGYQGRDRFFDSIDDLFAFFLDELNTATPGRQKNTFIADRPAMANSQVMGMQTKARKLLWLPINHIDDGVDPVNGMISGVYSQPLSGPGLKQIDGIVVMTAIQKHDLEKRLNTKTPIYQVSGGIAPDVAKVPMNNRVNHQIIHVGRLGWDKQIDQVLQVFKQIHSQVSDATLKLYGYGDGADVEKFKQQVTDLKLDEPGLVSFEGYRPDIDNVYDQAQLYLDCARIDGQPLADVEALGHGVPVLAYDYNYGPRELIEDGKNGKLIKLNDVATMASEAVKLLKGKKKLQDASDQAYELSARSSAEAVWKQWQNARV